MARRSSPSSRPLVQPAGVSVSSFRWSYLCSDKRLWKAITTRIDRWWPRDFLAHPKARRFVLEARLGGRMFEDAGKGAGLLWGTVWSIEPGRSLVVVGHSIPRFGGPSTGMMEFTIEPAPKGKDGCTLAFTHAIYGRTDKATIDCLKEGWTALFDISLRKHLEEA